MCVCVRVCVCVSVSMSIVFVFFCVMCREARLVRGNCFVCSFVLLFVWRRGLREVIVGWLSCTPLAPPCPGTS